MQRSPADAELFGRGGYVVIRRSKRSRDQFFSVSRRSILCNDKRCLDYAWYDKSGDLIFVRLFT